MDIRERGKMVLRLRRRGNVLVFFVIALGVLMATLTLTLDYGHLLVMRWRLQTAVDAAALSGGRALISPAGQGESAEWKAENEALDIADRNISASYSVTFPTSTECDVSGDLAVNLYLGSFIGIDSMTVTASATSEVTGISSAKGIRPFGVEQCEEGYVFGELYDLKMGAPDPVAAGNFHALSIDGTGASVYRNNIIYGSSSTISVGDWLDTEPGNMVGPTEDAIEYLMQLEVIEEGVEYILDQDQIAWDWYLNNIQALESSPRLITIPVVGDWSGAYGRSAVQVVAFARFFIDGMVGEGKDCRITGRFVETIVPGAAGGGNPGYGAYSVQLVE